jgi:acetolactate synthase-1/2/3 large subunit
LTGLSELVSPLVLAPDVERFLSALASKRALRIEDAYRYTENPIHPLRIVAELQKWLADDVTLCLDMGSFHLWIAHFPLQLPSATDPDQQWPTDAWRCTSLGHCIVPD